jgi:chromosome segregation ATPase
MNNLLFTALIIALIYYFFYYLPQQKKITNPHPTKLTHTQATQTEELERTITDNEPGMINCPGPQFTIDSQELEELKKDIQQKETKLSEAQTQITKLQSEIRDLVKRPLKPTNSKSTQTDNKDLENTLDTLIKNIQQLNNEL